MHYRQPHQVHLVECAPERADRTLEYRGVSEVEGKAGFVQQGAGLLCFGHAFFSQVNVGPAGETVVKIPGGFAVAHQYNFVHIREWEA